MASRPFYQVADRVLGSQFLEDIAEFFILFQTMYPGFVERARAVERLLLDRRTTFVVVSTLEAAPVREAEFFIAGADRQEVPPRCPGPQPGPARLPARRGGRRPGRPPVRRRRRAGAAATTWPARCDTDEAQLSRVLAEIGENFQQLRGRGPPRGRPAPRARGPVRRGRDRVPEFEADIHDLPGLLRLGERIWA